MNSDYLTIIILVKKKCTVREKIVMRKIAVLKLRKKGVWVFCFVFLFFYQKLLIWHSMGGAGQLEVQGKKHSMAFSSKATNSKEHLLSRAYNRPGK